jgi:hypothetical protein
MCASDEVYAVVSTGPKMSDNIKELSRAEAYEYACEHMQPFTGKELVEIEKHFSDLYTEL